MRAIHLRRTKMLKEGQINHKRVKKPENCKLMRVIIKPIICYT
jgi:hypothetical protein